MTSKEIAISTLSDITRSSDTARGYWSWQEQAEQHVSGAFSAARDNRKSVTAVSDELVKCAFDMGKRFGDCMCMAVGSVLMDWLRFNMLRGHEITKARKMLEY